MTNNMQSRVEKVKSFNLKDKPFTQKLFLRAAKSIDDSITYLKEMVQPDKLKDIQEDKTVESFTITSISCITQDINKEVLKRNNIEHQILFDNTNKEAFRLIVLFTYWCTMAINKLLQDEGLKVNVNDLTGGVLKQFVILEKDEERIKQIEEGYVLLLELVNTKDENVLKWYNHLINAILIYVMSFENANKNISEEDNITLISTLFGKMMSAYENNSEDNPQINSP